MNAAARDAVGQEGDDHRLGLLAGAAAYGLWGLFPLYFHLLEPTSALEILLHRVVWTLVVMSVFLALRGDRGWTAVLRGERRTTLMLCLAAVVIAANWLVYVWAVSVERVVEASLGYFICPLLTVVLGVVVLREWLRPLQWFAAALGAVAVTVLGIAYGQVPWISLALAVSFSTYGFLKKTVDVPPTRSLAAEALLLSPLALAGLVAMEVAGDAEFGASLGLSLLLAGTGVVTALPLLLFGAAARRIPLSLLGLLQYVTPSIQFVLGVVVFGEEISPEQWVGFALVWTALALLSADAVRAASAGRGGDEQLSPAAAELG